MPEAAGGIERGGGEADASSDQPMGGTEIVHLAAHKGRLYAGNGYWMDPRVPNIPWAQVLVLKDRDGAWEVDLALKSRHLRVTRASRS